MPTAPARPHNHEGVVIAIDLYTEIGNHKNSPTPITPPATSNPNAATSAKQP